MNALELTYGPRMETRDTVAPPLGESGELYYCKRDDFVRYIDDEVNPARLDAGLAPLDMKTAEECFRILNDFAREWGCNPLTTPEAEL